MEKIEIEINQINLKINEIELLLEKDHKEWTSKEKQKFGNHKQLRKEKEQLRKEKEQLRDLLLLKEKENQNIASSPTAGSILMSEGETRNTYEQSKSVSFKLDNISSALENLALTVAPLAEEFIRRYFYTNDKATKIERGNKFKENLIVYYYEVHFAVSEIKCMFSGIVLPAQVVIGAHLFKSCWAKDCQARLGFDNINNPRNGLLLFKPFEYAFDNSHICFQFDVEKELFSMKILNPDLELLTIKEYIQKEKEMDCTYLLKSRDDWRNTFQMNPYLTDEDMKVKMEAVDNLLEILEQKFSSFEGKYLEHTDEKKCFGRCLSFQASMARLEMGWVKKENVKSPSMFSELENKKKEQLNNWFKAVEFA